MMTNYDHILVRRAKVRYFKVEYISDWTKKSWLESSTKEVEVTIMVHGWFMMWFESPNIASWFLGQILCVDFIPLLLKRWNPLCDMSWEKLEALLFWVRLQILLPQLWTKDVFRAIGNKVGEYLEAYMSFITTGTRKVARILVKLDPWEGLFEDLKLSLHGHSHTQQL